MIIIYHNDFDGYCSAAIALKALNPTFVRLLRADHQDKPIDVQNETIYMLDFSYPVKVMEKLNPQGG